MDESGQIYTYTGKELSEKDFENASHNVLTVEESVRQGYEKLLNNKNNDEDFIDKSVVHMDDGTEITFYV